MKKSNLRLSTEVERGWGVGGRGVWLGRGVKGQRDGGGGEIRSLNFLPS